MKNIGRARERTIAEQVSVMKNKYPNFIVNQTSPSTMKVSGTIRPTARSAWYTFVLKYSSSDNPKVTIVSPELQKNEKGDDIPHLYPAGHLCLYHPDYQEFTRAHFLCDTIIPWISLWLYYYELWHVTGDWLGGGEHPIKLKPFQK